MSAEPCHRCGVPTEMKLKLQTSRGPASSSLCLSCAVGLDLLSPEQAEKLRALEKVEAPAALEAFRVVRRAQHESWAAYLAAPSSGTAEAMARAGAAFVAFVDPYTMDALAPLFQAAEIADGPSPLRPIVCTSSGCYQPVTHVERLPVSRRAGAWVCPACKVSRPLTDWVPLEILRGVRAPS